MSEIRDDLILWKSISELTAPFSLGAGRLQQQKTTAGTTVSQEHELV